jgi:taurine dioxygenase
VPLTELRPVTARTGAVAEGVDLRTLTPTDVPELRTALATWGVLFFRDQHLDDDEHLAFASLLGEPNRSPYGDGVLEHLVDGPGSRPSADLWHTDMAFLPEPPDYAVLSMLSSPPAGGDTLWANLFELHDALSPAMQRAVAPLRQELRRARIAEGGGYEPDPSAPAVEHPIVRVHPVTGRRALYLCGAFVAGIAGMHPAEGRALYEQLRAGVHDPTHQVRWRWRDGDVAVWDERCTNHRALGDHWPQHRHVRRCTVGASPVLGPEG